MHVDEKRRARVGETIGFKLWPVVARNRNSLPEEAAKRSIVYENKPGLVVPWCVC